MATETEGRTALTQDDIRTLCEALEAWEAKDGLANFMGEVIGTMFAKTPEQKAEAQMERIAAKEEAEAQRRLRKRTSILLQAKLLQLVGED